MKGNIEVAITKVAARAVAFAASTASITEKRKMVELLNQAVESIESIIEADRNALMGGGHNV